jgi:hypothetical protein
MRMRNRMRMNREMRSERSKMGGFDLNIRMRMGNRMRMNREMRIERSKMGGFDSPR